MSCTLGEPLAMLLQHKPNNFIILCNIFFGDSNYNEILFPVIDSRPICVGGIRNCNRSGRARVVLPRLRPCRGKIIPVPARYSCRYPLDGYLAGFMNTRGYTGIHEYLLNFFQVHSNFTTPTLSHQTMNQDYNYWNNGSY